MSSACPFRRCNPHPAPVSFARTLSLMQSKKIYFLSRAVKPKKMRNVYLSDDISLMLLSDRNLEKYLSGKVIRPSSGCQGQARGQRRGHVRGAPSSSGFAVTRGPGDRGDHGQGWVRGGPPETPGSTVPLNLCQAEKKTV